MTEATSKICTGCGRILPLPQFIRDARRSDGYASICRDCASERAQAGKRGERKERWDPRPWHQGCSECNEHPRNDYPGRKCRHPGAVQGALRREGGSRATFIPEGHVQFPSPAPWDRAGQTERA
jgi:hypothetical protein